jgi:NAD+ synthase (glutamine-hydrolysing)
MLIALAQQNYIIGNFEYNCKKIIEAIEKAEKQNVDLIVFSELSVCGYPPHDLLEDEYFVKKSIECVKEIAQHCGKIAAIVGAPSVNTNPQGKGLFNTAFFLHDKKIIAQYHKALLPTYDIFDEYRYFEPGAEFKVIEFRDERIAITICEDLWDEIPDESIPYKRARMYNVSPMAEMAAQRPTVVVNIAASPFSYSKIKLKQEIFCNHAKKYRLPLLYVNQIGAHTDLIFDGGSMVIDSKGQVAGALNLFEEDFRIIDSKNITLEDKKSIEKPEIEKMHDALVLGIRDYFQKSGLKKATLGLSGGIDSAIVLVLAVKALGEENVRVLLMPSKYSSDHSVNDALKLADNLGIQKDIVNIQQTVDSFKASLSPLFANLPEDITEENIQARTRGVLLMAISNKFGHILLNTSNKSEIAVGYGTLYGDMNGGLSVMGDVYKSDVYKLAHFINKDKEVIPQNIIDKAPSAELRPDQKDSDSLPDYALLDAILFQYIENQRCKKEIIDMGYDKAVVEKIIKMVNFNEYKRFQTPPILRISSKSFGFGRRMPIVAKY